MKKTEDQILDAADEWHNSDSNLTLHEFLGWTWEQYKAYVEDGLIPDE